jgi:glycosyltransferase involved in cell wall biosynthesis
MKVIHVIPSIEEEASGPAYSVPSLSNAMRNAGTESCLVSTVSNQVEEAAGFKTFSRRRFPYRVGRSPEMYRWLCQEVSSGAIDIVHNHGIWMMPNVYPGWVTRGSQTPLVVSPRGTFSEWAMNHSKAVKIPFWHVFQKRAISGAALFHATSEGEYGDIRRLNFRQPIAVIPNGVDLPLLDEPRFGARRSLLFLGRVHPVKGVDNLLRAWAALESRFEDWDLRIVGPGDEGYLRELDGLATSLRVTRATFDGSLYGAAKEQAYRSADLFVLPTHSENFGIAVAEALAAGCPVITTKGAPWSGLREHGAGWWIDIGVDPLRRALEVAMSKPRQELAAMGSRGRSWMERDFSWDKIATQMIEAYRWLREGGVSPDWIRHD